MSLLISLQEAITGSLFKRFLRQILGIFVVFFTLVITVSSAVSQQDDDIAEKDEDEPIPVLEIKVSKEMLSTGETVQLTLFGAFPDGAIRNLTASLTGTTYASSDSDVASVNLEGLVTGITSGQVTITAFHVGIAAPIVLTVVDQDQDNDGLPDTFEVLNGFDPTDPGDGEEDLDVDSLTNFQEFQLGTDPRNADSDGDGFIDGEEIERGTDPLTPTSRLDDTCIVTMLNRTSQVNPNGTFAISNVPVEQGFFRVRAVCQENGTTTSGSSEFLTLVPDLTSVNSILFGETQPVPVTLRLSSPKQSINTPGQSVQFTAFAKLPNNSEKDVTRKDTGTLWMSSKSDIASVSADGLVTAHKRGKVLIQARNEGLIAALALEVLIPNDTDGDGMTDEFENANGLNPNNPSDATQDPDGDGLTNLEEFQKGINPRAKDSDGDGLSDKQEVTRGTNPLNADTDNDGLLDGVEDRYDTKPNISDTDSDGITDGNEVALGLDPLATTATTTVTGRVTEQNGAALAGAAAVAFDRFTAITDNNGNFTITHVPATLGTIAVFARAVQNGQALDGFSAPTAPVTNGTTNVGTIALQAVAGRVSGTVLSTTGRPVVGARVVVVSGADERSVTSDARGVYQVEQMPPGRVIVVATDPRSRLRGQSQGTLTTGQSLALNVSLTASGTLFGTVFQRDAITPVGAGVAITVSGPIELDLETNAAGQYRADFVPLGSYSIDAEDLVGNRGLTAVNLSSSNQAIQADVTFLGKGTVTGTVKNAAGIPVAGASVSLTSKSVFGGKLGATTDASGVYRIPEVFVGNFTLAANDPVSGLGGTAGDSVDADGQDVTVPITLVPAGTITGTVFEADGVTPAVGVSVSTAGRSTTTNAGGVYRLPFLPLGFYTLDAAKPNTDDRGRSSAGLNQEGQEATANIVLSGLGTVQVSVVDGSGAPVPGVQVRFGTGSPLNDLYCSLCRKGSTDVEGIVTFINVIVAPFSVSASDPIGMRGGSASASVQPGQRVNVSIVLEAAGDIFGTVFAPDGVTPAANITVKLSPLNRAITTNVDGRFHFELVPTRFSPFRLDAYDASGAIRATAENIIVPAQDAEVQRNLILSGRGIVLGTVRTPTGTLAAGASVVISSQAPGGASYQATTDASGHYLVRNIAQGPFSVFASLRQVRQGGSATGEIRFHNEEARADVQMLDNQVPPDTRTITTLFDANNFRFEVQNIGSIQDGEHQVYRGNNSVQRGGLRLDLVQGNVLSPFVGGAESFEENNREVVIAGNGPAGLQVTRKIYIPQDGYFARYLEILQNPGTTPVTVDVRVDSHFRIVSRLKEGQIFPEPVRLVSTSSGDDLFTTADRWVTLDDDLDEDPFVNTGTTPALAFVYAGANASQPIGAAQYDFPEAQGFSRVRTQWTSVTVPPGQTRILMHFAVQDFSRAAAQAAAERLVQLPPEVLVGLSAAEREFIVNFAVPSTSSLPPLPPLDGVISGLVREGDAVTPVSGATVRLQSSDALFSRSFTLKTAPNGRYELRSNLTTGGSFVPVPRGAFTVQATHPLTARTSALVTGNFPANSNTATQDITFTELGLLGGTVTRPDGTVVSGVRVEISGTPLLNSIRTGTGVDGTYFVTGLPAGNYTVTATLENPNGTGLAGATSGVVNARAKSTLNVVIDPAGGVEGTVLTGAGVPAVNVEVQLIGSGFSRGTRTDTGGRYKFFDSRVGTLTVRAVEPKTRIPTVTEVAIVEGQITQKNLQLIGFGTVNLTVSFSDGTPVVGAPVQISEVARGESFRAVGSTNAQGRITIQDVTVGDFTLRVTHPSNAALSVDVPSLILRDGDTATLQATVPRDAAPTVMLTKPTPGSSFAPGATVAMEATAADDLGIDRVEFKVNGVIAGTDNTAPYAATAQLPIVPVGSTVQLTAEAVDTSGQRTGSQSVSVTIVADQPPTITLTQAPANGSQVQEGSLVTFVATASDDVGVAAVELRVNGVVQQTDTTAPYQFQWVVPPASSVTNPVKITLTARDTRNQTATTPEVNLTVKSGSSQCALLADDLMSWWKAEGNAEDSISANDGTLQNGATFAPGIVGQALSFDGVDDYVSIADSPDWDFGMKDFTMEFWVKFDQVKDSMFLHQQSGTVQGGFEFDFQKNDSILVFARDPTHGVIRRPWVPQVDTWHHLAVTRTNSVYRLYADGTQVGTEQADANPVTNVSGPVRIGNWAFTGNINYNVDGLMDEVSIHNRALSATEIQSIFNAGSAGKCTNETCAPLPSGAVSVWRADGTASDSVGSNNGTLQNGASYAPGKVGQAFSLDGVDDYVQIGDHSNLRMTNALTLEAWIYPTGPGSGSTDGGIIVNKEGEYEVGTNPDGTIWWAIANSSPGWTAINTGYVAPVNQWTHIVVVYDGISIRTYADGLLVHTQNGTGNIGDNHPEWNDFRIGGRQCTHCLAYFKGRIDEVSIYNRALSAAEAKALFNAGSAGKCSNQNCAPLPSGAVSWWSGDGNAQDLVSSNNGALQGGATFAPGKVSQAFSLDGVDDYLAIPDSPTQTPTSLTLESWVFPDSINGLRTIVSKYQRDQVSWLLSSVDGRIRFGVFQNGVGTIAREIDSTQVVLSPGVWQHVAGTFDQATQTIKIYINGNEAPAVFVPGHSSNVASIFDSTGPVRIGTLSDGSDNFTSYLWDGLIDEVSLYNRALSAQEVQAIYDAGSAGNCKEPFTTDTDSDGLSDGAEATLGTDKNNRDSDSDGLSDGAEVKTYHTKPLVADSDGDGYTDGIEVNTGSNPLDPTNVPPLTRCVAPPSGLVSWWKGEGNAEDVISANDGTLQNGATFAPGKVGQAFSFDGVDDYVQVGDTKNLKMTNAVTMETWIFPTGPGSHPTSGGGIVSKEGEYQVWRFPDGTIRWAFANTNPGWVAINTGYTALLNQWTHLVVTYDAGLVKTYVNGILIHTFSGSGSIGDARPQENSLILGAADCSPCKSFHGFLDEVSVYNAVPSDAEVKALFDAGNAGKCRTSISLNFDSLPSAQGWTYVSGGGGAESAIFSVNGGVLTMNSLGKGGAPPHYEFPGVLDVTLPFTLSLRARVTGYEGETANNAFGFGVFGCGGTQSERFGIGLSPTRLMTGEPRQSVSVDASQFHEYVAKGTPPNSYQVFVDGNLLLTGQSLLSSCPYGLWLGDGTGGPNARAEITRFSFTQP